MKFKETADTFSDDATKCAPFPKRLLNAHVNWADFDTKELKYVPCNICGSFDFSILASIVINSIEFFLVECRECNLIWRNPLPGNKFLYSLYTEQYFDTSEMSSLLKEQVGIADTTTTDRIFRDDISAKVVQSWVDLGISPQDPNGQLRKLLEIGGGRGYLQKAAKEKGWITIGMEISPHGIAEAKKNGISLLPYTLYESRMKHGLYEKQFDLVVFYDFLEHVDDPAQYLRVINHMLADDGIIIFRVPHTAGCPRLHLIDHVWHFSTKSLRYLLEKENLVVWHAHYSGRFFGQHGNYIDNITIFARKVSSNDQIFPEINLQPNPLGL